MEGACLKSDAGTIYFSLQGPNCWRSIEQELGEGSRCNVSSFEWNIDLGLLNSLQVRVKLLTFSPLNKAIHLTVEESIAGCDQYVPFKCGYSYTEE